MNIGQSTVETVGVILVVGALLAAVRPVDIGRGLATAMKAGAGHVRCGTCGEYLDEFIYQLVELHPHPGAQ